MERHREEIAKKSKMGEKDFEQLLSILLGKVQVVPKEALLRHKEKANEMVAKIDPDDAIFVACALEYPGSAIWSDDKKLKRLAKVKVMNTKEVIEMIYGKFNP